MECSSVDLFLSLPFWRACFGNQIKIFPGYCRFVARKELYSVSVVASCSSQRYWLEIITRCCQLDLWENMDTERKIESVSCVAPSSYRKLAGQGPQSGFSPATFWQACLEVPAREELCFHWKQLPRDLGKTSAHNRLRKTNLSWQEMGKEMEQGRLELEETPVCYHSTNTSNKI